MTSSTVKRCSRCGRTKPRSEFNRRSSAKDRLCYWCRSCTKKHNHKYRRSTHGRETRARYVQSDTYKQSCARTYKRTQGTEKRKEQQRRAQERRIKRYPEKYHAHKAVRCAVRSGRLPHPSSLDCTDCGMLADQYHHESYAEQDRLSVIPLCQQCHTTRHKRNRRGLHSVRSSPILA